MLTKYMNGDYDLANSFVIGDRLTDIQLAKNLGAKGILINDGSLAEQLEKDGLADTCSWFQPIGTIFMNVLPRRKEQQQ